MTISIFALNAILNGNPILMCFFFVGYIEYKTCYLFQVFYDMMGTRFTMDMLKHTIGFVEFLLYIGMRQGVKLATYIIRLFSGRNFSYETSALLKRVLVRKKLFIGDQALPRDFLTWPIKTIHPT